ncbi:MAG: hypothetical protein ACQKBY_05385, partial [Verrucomicrobiales bacterium]
SRTFSFYDADNVLLGRFANWKRPVPTPTDPYPAFLPDGSVAGETAEDRFFGVIHDGGILRIQYVGGSLEFDHLQVGTIPEPGVSLFAFLALTLLLRGRSRG